MKFTLFLMKLIRLLEKGRSYLYNLDKLDIIWKSVLIILF